jgi:hypothetical protein
MNWKTIPSFQSYSVSDMGQVRNDDTGRIMAIRKNPHGVRYVGLMKGAKQRNVSLPRLVAEAFVARPPQDRKQEFTAVIHLNGEQDNNRADNLMWRPHWFAMKYTQQFKVGPTIETPVVELKTQEFYACPWVAALSFGLLEREIVASGLNRTFVWPTFQEFRFVEE